MTTTPVHDALTAEAQARLAPTWLVDVLGQHWRPLDTQHNRSAPEQARRYVLVDSEDDPTPMVATAVQVAQAYGYARRIPAPVQA